MKQSYSFFLYAFSITNPKALPRIKVIIETGTKLKGSFHAINMAHGARQRKEIKMPFIMGFIFKPDVEINKPAIVHMLKAERFASHVSF